MTIRKLFFRISVIIILFPVLGFLYLFLNYQFISFSVRDQIYTNVADLPFQPFTLVLGSGNFEPEKYTNYSLNYRADAAHQIAVKNKTNTFIASGVKSETGMNEATDLKLVMGLAGVDTSKIVLDSLAHRTFKSITNALDLTGNNGVIIVSQKDHLERAIFIGNCIGMTSVGFVAQTPEQPEHKIFYREHLARVKCIFDCLKFNLF